MDQESLDENAQVSDELLDDEVPVSDEITEVTETKEEPKIPQSKLAEIVGKARKAGYAKGRRDTLQELEAQVQQPTADASAPVAPAMTQQPSIAPQAGMGGMQQMSEEQIAMMVANQVQKAREAERAQQFQEEQKQAAHGLVQEFLGKMALGSELYPDFEDTVKQLELDKMPEIVHLANSTENTAEVMYELAKNPSKIGSLALLYSRSPNLAASEVKKLAASIAENKAATSARRPNEPLNQIKPSTVGADNGSKLSIKDLRSQPWLKA